MACEAVERIFRRFWSDDEITPDRPLEDVIADAIYQHVFLQTRSIEEMIEKFRRISLASTGSMIPKKQSQINPSGWVAKPRGAGFFNIVSLASSILLPPCAAVIGRVRLEAGPNAINTGKILSLHQNLKPVLDELFDLCGNNTECLLPFLVPSSSTGAVAPAESRAVNPTSLSPGALFDASAFALCMLSFLAGGVAKKVTAKREPDVSIYDITDAAQRADAVAGMFAALQKKAPPFYTRS